MEITPYSGRRSQQVSSSKIAEENSKNLRIQPFF